MIFEIGKLYQYTGLWSTGLYHSPHDIGFINKIRQGEMFVILEQQNISTHMHYRVLTTKGEIGWITPGPIYIVLMEKKEEYADL